MPFRRSPLIAALYEHFPPIVLILQGVKIEREKIIEEVSFYLATEDVNFRA